MFTVECFFCHDGITPNSGLTRPNNTIYIYIYARIYKCYINIYIYNNVIYRINLYINIYIYMVVVGPKEE